MKIESEMRKNDFAFGEKMVLIDIQYIGDA